MMVRRLLSSTVILPAPKYSGGQEPSAIVQRTRQFGKGSPHTFRPINALERNLSRCCTAQILNVVEASQSDKCGASGGVHALVSAVVGIEACVHCFQARTSGRRRRSGGADEEDNVAGFHHFEKGQSGIPSSEEQRCTYETEG